jgi:hypothetical protein
MSHKKVPAQGYCARKGMICVCPMDVCTRNLWQKADKGKKTSSESASRFLRASCFKKPTHSMPEIWGRMYNVLSWNAKGTRKWDKKLDSHAAKKGVKKLVSSNFAKILE